MSSEKNNQTGVPKDKMRMAVISAIITLVAIMAIGITAFFYGKNQSTKEQTGVSVINVTTDGGQKVLGAAEFSWSGIITKIDKYKITFNASVKKSDGAYAAVTVTATADKNTELTEWDLTAPPVSGQTATSQVKINFSDFKVGQQIVVKSSNDIDEKNEISATAIKLLLTPGNS